MNTKELSEAAVEINAILINIPDEISKMIPKEFKDYFNKIASTEYKFEYDISVSLSNQKLLPKTKGILAYIYREYLCNEDEREAYIKECNKVLNKIEKEKYDKYNPNELFKNKENKQKNSIKENVSLLKTDTRKNNLFIKIFEKIKSIFKVKS